VILCDSGTLESDSLSIPAVPEKSESPTNPSLEDMERDYILRVLRENDGNQTKTCRLLGIDRKTLYLKLKKYGLQG